jgi:hypothetical protein
VLQADAEQAGSRLWSVRAPLGRMSHRILQKGLAFRHEKSVTSRAWKALSPFILPRRLRCQCGALVVTAPGAAT